MTRPFQMISTITGDQLRDLIRASISDMPEWDPSFGLTEQQTAFAHAASPQLVAAILDELDGYKQGAKAEADAGDEARKEAKRLKGLLHMLITQAIPLESIPDLPGYSRVVDAERLVEENKTLRMFSNQMLECVFEGGALDGGDIAVIGVRCGVLTVRDVEERCGDVCACAEYGFPGECFRKTDVMRGDFDG